MKDTEIQNLALTVVTNLNGNPNLSNPPIDPKVLKADADNLGLAIIAAQDGSRKAITQKNKLREVVINDLRIIGRYVEVAANGDPAIFASSGLKPTSGTRTPPVPLSPHFQYLKHGGLSGQILAKLKKVPGASSYVLRHTAVVNGVSGTWTEQIVTGVAQPVVLNGLTPGTLYAFQARALDKAGYSDWSDSVTLMCI